MKNSSKFWIVISIILIIILMSCIDFLFIMIPIMLIVISSERFANASVDSNYNSPWYKYHPIHLVQKYVHKFNKWINDITENKYDK